MKVVMSKEDLEKVLKTVRVESIELEMKETEYDVDNSYIVSHGIVNIKFEIFNYLKPLLTECAPEKYNVEPVVKTPKQKGKK